MVKRNVASGKWESHPVRKKDKARHKSDVYVMFNLIYDENQCHVKGFYPCKKCSEVVVADLHGGNYKLNRHRCYKEYLTQQDNENQQKKLAKRKDDDSDDEVLFLNKIVDMDLETNLSKNANGDDHDDNDDDDDISDHGQPIKIEGNQHTILALNFYKYGKVVVEHGLFSSQIIKRFLPTTFDADAW